MTPVKDVSDHTQAFHRQRLDSFLDLSIKDPLLTSIHMTRNDISDILEWS